MSRIYSIILTLVLLFCNQNFVFSKVFHISLNADYSLSKLNLNIPNNSQNLNHIALHSGKNLGTIGGSLHVGFGIGNNFALELELGHLSKKYKIEGVGNSATLLLRPSMRNAFINGYFYFFNNMVLRPYLMCGLGSSKLKLSHSKYHDISNNDVTEFEKLLNSYSKNKFTAQAGIGADVSLFSSTYLTLGYKAVLPTKVLINYNSNKLEIKNSLRHVVFLGVGFAL